MFRCCGDATAGAVRVAGGWGIHEFVQHRDENVSLGTGAKIGGAALIGGAAAGTGAFLGIGAAIEGGSALLGRPYASLSGLGIPAALGIAGIGGAVIGWQLAND
jgi:hypothetical protein